LQNYSIKESFGQFQIEEFSCPDHSRTGRLSSDLAEPLCDLSKEFPFSSGKASEGWLMTSRITVTPVLRDNFGLQKHTRRWVPHNLTEMQKVESMRLSRSLPKSLRLPKGTEFKGLATEDESWISDRYQETSKYALSRDEIPPMVRNTIGTSEVTWPVDAKGAKDGRLWPVESISTRQNISTKAHT
jgi:hypothetical protein